MNILQVTCLLVVTIATVANGNTLRSSLKERIAAAHRQEGGLYKRDHPHPHEHTNTRREQVVENLIERLIKDLQRRELLDDLESRMGCGVVDADQLIADFTADAAQLDCVYGYILEDWRNTLRNVPNSPGGRDASVVEVITCLDGILGPVLDDIIASRSDLDHVPGSCSAWSGRFSLDDCHNVLSDNGYSDQQMMEYVTRDNACEMHEDMVLLEGVVAAAGEVGSVSGSPPLELCFFNYLVADARWWRTKYDLDCDYRMESREVVEKEETVNGLVALLRKVIGSN